MEFEVHEVYAVDVLISTGEGKVGADLTQQFKTNMFRKHSTMLSSGLIRPRTEARGPPSTKETQTRRTG